MAPIRLLTALAASWLAAGCYQPESAGYSTFPEPYEGSGPPGGDMDPAWQEPYSGGYSESYPASEDNAAMTPSSDPQAAGYVMGATTDVEIDSTLSGYGEWIEVENYGRVWRPYTSSVGLDFTPYESCGSWVWTEDWGWTYACEWDWGWLPFHYGRWGWFEDSWAWQPGYDWSPGWVEWRSGDEYCGWRPLSPTQSDGYWDNGSWVGTGGGGGGGAVGGGNVSYGSSGGGWNVRDHRDNPSPGTYTVPKNYKIPALQDSHWRFAKRDDFGKKIRPNLFKAPAEGLRVTKLATRPPMKGTTRAVNAASIMRSRLVTREMAQRRAASRVDISKRPDLDRRRRMPDGSRPAPARPLDHHVRNPPSPVERMWPRPAPVDRPNDRSYGRGPGSITPSGAREATPPPGRARDFSPPGQQRDVTRPPSRPSSPARDYSPPSQPARDYSPPSRPSAPARDYSPPSQPSRPSRDDSSSRSSGGNWSPPSRGSSSPSQSSGSSGGGGSHAPSRGSSGGGRRR